MKYYIEIRMVKDECCCHCQQTYQTVKWERVQPTGGQSYAFKTKAEAEHIREMCYSQFSDNVIRITKGE